MRWHSRRAELDMVGGQQRQKIESLLEDFFHQKNVEFSFFFFKIKINTRVDKNKVYFFHGPVL
jgi:hypothetical protein